MSDTPEAVVNPKPTYDEMSFSAKADAHVADARQFWSTARGNLMQASRALLPADQQAVALAAATAQASLAAAHASMALYCWRRWEREID